jgi:hypothetical protein
MTLAINANVAVELTVELPRGPHRPPRPRVTLRKEASSPRHTGLRPRVARRQLARVVGSLAGIDDALEGAEIKAAQAAADFLKATAR